MTILFQDDFNRSQQLNGSANWNTPNSAGNFNCNGTQLVIDIVTSIEVAATTTSAHAAIADCKVSATRRTGSGFDGGVFARGDGTNANMYMLDVYGTNNVDIIRRVGGTDTTVASRNTTHANGDIYRLEISGTGATVTFKVYKNGVQMGADATDTSGSRIVSAGRTGIFTYTNSAINFDDFLVEDFAGAGASNAVRAMNYMRQRRAS